MGTALVVVAALALLYVLSRRQDGLFSVGPVLATRRKRGFLSVPQRHRLLDYKSVIIADERGTTEIDVIVVGNAGVFVVELKDFNAWVFGSEEDEKWTACYLDRSKYQFQNPLRQNFRHIKALQARLGLPLELFESIVAFTGNCEFKTPLPSNVIVGSYRRFIERIDGVKLTDSEVKRVCDMLETLEAASTDIALDAHVADIHARYSSTTTCPKCGAALVKRRARAAAADEPGFLGCQAYPRCRYTRQLDAV